MKKGKRWFSIIVFIIGFLICLYPLAASAWEGHIQKDTISTYSKDVGSIDSDTLKDEIRKAEEYNSILFQTMGASIGNYDAEILSDESYSSMLNLSNTGVMGTIQIPKIDVNLPIYHGTDDQVLSNGVGHVQTSSLPVGGNNTRTLLTGHRGLPNSKLFTRLDELEEGDLFFIELCGKILAYEVYSIEVIEPDEVGKLDPINDEDIATLITCTPYGINTQRLIVNGKRIPYSQKVQESIKEEMMSIREIFFTILPFVFLLILLVKEIRERRKA